MPSTNSIQIGSVTIQVLIASRDTGGRYTICEMATASQGGIPPHSHGYEDTFVYVVEGRFEFRTRDSRRVADAGTSLFVPKDVMFSLRNQCDAPGRCIVIAQPGGLDLLFQDMEFAARPGAARDATVPAILEKHGIVLSSNSDAWSTV